MARIQGRYYSIEAARFCEIGNTIQARYGEYDAGALLDLLVNTDWPEGAEHQGWLDLADDDQIAAWAAVGIGDVAREHAGLTA